MDSLQELQSEVINLQLEAIQARIDELSTPSNPYETTFQHLERFVRLIELRLILYKEERKRQEEQEQLKWEQERRERENFMNSFPSREAYWLHCTMEEHRRTIAEFERTLSPEEAAELKRVRNDRRTVRAQITKTVNKLNAALASESKTAVKMYVTDLTEIKKKLSNKDEDVWALMSDDCVVADQAIGLEWSD